ncbi:C-C motif chemokine 4 homolog [Rhynochetos jubatus]
MKTSTAALAVLTVAILCYQVSSSPYSVNLSGPCCVRYSTKAFPLSRVVRYEHTGSHCSQPAVIFELKELLLVTSLIPKEQDPGRRLSPFITVTGRMVCGNPDDKWVQDIMNHQRDKAGSG